MRVPAGGRLLSGAAERTMIQPVPALAGRGKGPVKVAPGCRVTTSPGWAASRAACRLPKAGTKSVAPVGGT